MECMVKGTFLVLHFLVTERTYFNNLPGWLWFCNVILSLSLSDVRSPLPTIGGTKKREVNAMTAFYCQTQKTVNTWKISGMLIVYWPITIKFRTCEQTSKPQTNYRCCLWFSYLAPYWLISRNTITFHKYFWCSRFCEFHSKQFLLRHSSI